MASGRRGTATGLANSNELLLSIKHKYWIGAPQNGSINNKWLNMSCWTCFRIWQRALSCPSPRTDPETSYSPSLIENIFNYIRYGQHDHQLWSFVFCDIEEHKKQVIEWSQTSRLITHNSQLKNMFFCSSVKKWICVPSSTFVKIQEKGILAFLIK